MLFGRVEGAEPPPDAPQQADERRHVKSRFPSEGVDQNAAHGIGHGGADGVACQPIKILIIKHNLFNRIAVKMSKSLKKKQKAAAALI
jgi:uncharacterized spore protein YtfJ